MFEQGDKVYCVNPFFSDSQREGIPNRPVTEVEYTVREYVEHMGLGRDSRAIRLVEIVNPLIVHPSGIGMIEPSFHISRFRLKSDIEIIKEETVEETVEL